MPNKSILPEELSEAPKAKLYKNMAIMALFAFASFALDLITPLGVAGGVPYVLVMITGWWFKSRFATLFLAFSSTILIVLGYFFSPSGGIGWIVLINRGYAIAAVWIVAILLLKVYGNFRESNISVGQSVKSDDGLFLRGWEGAFVTFLSIIIIMSTWMVVSRIQKQEMRDIERSVQAVLDTAHISIVNQYAAQKSFAKVWADNDQIKLAFTQLSLRASIENDMIGETSLLDDQENNVLEKIQQLFSSVLETGGYRGFFIIGDGNINLASSRGNNVGTTNLLSLQENFLERVWGGETLISLPQKSDVPIRNESGNFVEDAPTMFVATPIYSGSGAVQAILAFRMDPHDIFTPIFERGNFGDSGETYAFDKQGLLMSHIRFEKQVRELGLIGSSLHADLSLYIKDPGADLTVSKNVETNHGDLELTGMVQRAVSGNSGSDMEGYRDYRGVPVIGVWIWDHELELGFATEMTVEEAYSSFNETRLVIIALATLSIGTLIVLVLVFRQNRRELSKNVRELDFQKFALDEHAIVSITDVAGKITYANKKFTESSGYSQSELIGNNHRIMKSDEHPPEFFQEMWGRLSKGKVWQGEVKNKDKNGNELWYMSTKVPFLDGDGKPFRYISISTDITKRKEAELLAMAANRAKSSIMANMSHELRTPLNAIIGFSSMMKDELFGPLGGDKYLEYIGDVHDSAEHLLALIVDILDVSAIEADALELQEDKMDLLEVVDSSIRLIKPRANKGMVSLHSKISTDFPDIFADKRRIKQIILNLLSNAVKFTVEGGDVTIDAKMQSDGSVSIFVTDTGVGMDEKEIRVALSTFGQVEHGFDRNHEGTGLGLPLTKGLVEMHDGTLEVESEKGMGTTVVITLPKERVLELDELIKDKVSKAI